MVQWFRRLGEIPGVTLGGIPEVDASRQPGYGAVPEVHTSRYEGKVHESLSWPDGNAFYSSASPAHNVAFGDLREPRVLSTDRLLECLYQGLSLPGEPSDYHFMILSCVQELWRRRHGEPDVLEKLERLCWLDVDLVEACPDAVTNENMEGCFYEVPAFSILADMYEREGAINEAFAVTERAAPFGQLAERRQQLAQRIAAVEQEVA